MLEYLGSSRVVEAPRKAGLAVRPRLFETAYVPLDSGSEVEVAHPAVGFEALHLILGQSPAVAYPHVPLHVSDRAHPRDHGRYGRVAQDVAERDLRHLVLGDAELGDDGPYPLVDLLLAVAAEDRKSTRLNSSHVAISYAVFCLKKKKKKNTENNQLPIKNTSTNIN